MNLSEQRRGRLSSGLAIAAILLSLACEEPRPPELTDTTTRNIVAIGVPADSAVSALPPGGVEAGAHSCEELREGLLARALDPFGSVDNDEQAQVIAHVNLAAALPGAILGETCAGTIVREVAASPRCGSAAELVTSAAASAGAFSVQVVRAALADVDARCAPAVLAGMVNVREPESAIIDAVIEWSRRQRDPMRRSGGLVALGSLAHSARHSHGQDAADTVDRVLVEELRQHAAHEAERLQRLEAIGNAGCSPCGAHVLRELRASSADVRRSAVGALRFMVEPSAARTMCKMLDTDPDTTVREQAAWALGWERGDAPGRVHCLITAAARDPSARVRQDAVLSLVDIGYDEQLARSALLHLTFEEYDPNVREIAGRFLDGFPASTPDGSLDPFGGRR